MVLRHVSVNRPSPRESEVDEKALLAARAVDHQGVDLGAPDLPLGATSPTEAKSDDLICGAQDLQPDVESTWIWPTDEAVEVVTSRSSAPADKITAPMHRFSQAQPGIMDVRVEGTR